MNFLTWTFTIVGIAVSLIPMLFGFFQYFNKQGNRKARVVKKSIYWGIGALAVLYFMGLFFWVEPERTGRISIAREPFSSDSLSMFRPEEIGVLVMQFEDISNTPEGDFVGRTFVGQIRNEINRRSEAILQKLYSNKKITTRATTSAKRVSKPMESHKEAREFGKRFNAEVVLWGSLLLLDFQAQNVQIIPHVTVVDTVVPEFSWDKGGVIQYDLKPIVLSFATSVGLESLQEPINTAVQLSLYSLCEELHQEQSKQEEFELLKELVALPNKYVEHLDKIYISLADLYSYFRDYTNELAILKKCQEETHSTSLSVLNNLANAYGKVGLQKNENSLIKKALQLDQELLYLDPQNQNVTYTNMGFFWLTLGDTSQALKYLHKALDFDSTTAETYGNFAYFYECIGNIDSAIFFIRNAIRLNPKRADIKRNYANYLYRDGDTLQAIAELKNAIAIDPEYPDVYNNLGSIYVEQGKYNNALPLFRKAIQVAPNFTGSYVSLAALYSVMGQVDDAYDLIDSRVKQIIEDDPMSQSVGEYGTGLISYITNSKDFSNLRNDRRWPELQKKLSKSKFDSTIFLIIIFVSLAIIAAFFVVRNVIIK